MLGTTPVTYISNSRLPSLQICARLNLTDVALDTYAEMLAAPVGSRLAPTVHAYTAAMRAATEGGRWLKALDIWEDMTRAGCQPTGEQALFDICLWWIRARNCC